MLGAAFLARVYTWTNEYRLLVKAGKAMHYSVTRQNENGSWFYGESPDQKWIDNFHTGYNLRALRNFSTYLNSNLYMTALHKGFQYYFNHFFTSDSKLPKYFHNKLFPIDIHSLSHSILTLAEFSNFHVDAFSYATSIVQWSLANMQSAEGFFYYQKRRFFKNKLAYMRWAQAWMLYALAIYAEQLRTGKK